ncbi:hypothetical protein DFAR_2990009 [Desulfarculales bacterium]
MLNHDGYMPRFILLTNAKVIGVTVTQGLALNPSSILILDRGYQDRTMPCLSRGPARASPSSLASNLTPFSR